MDLWKHAYRAEFDSDPDEDMAEHADEIEAWRASWQGGYDRGEPWATDLLLGTAADEEEEEEAPGEAG
jgi:hypothetical protein